MKNKLLYIEDDTEIATWVREDLEDRGYEVTWLGSGEGLLRRRQAVLW